MERISWVHGAGGKLMSELIRELVLKELSLRRAGEIGLDELQDGATVEIEGKSLVLTTDSYTVRPTFFPGGNIGSLAVSGTVNDLAVMGARPLAMACSMVLPEGMEKRDLLEICKSINRVSLEVKVPIITGDLKVAEKNGVDGPVITTTGVGLAERVVKNSGLRAGDKILISGTIGEHGACILACRYGFGPIQSDAAPVLEVVEAAMRAGEVTAMKDPTRGGLAAALNDLAEKSGVGIELEESLLPVSEEVRNLCDLLGLDVLTLACEGRVVMGVRPGDAEKVLEAIRRTRRGERAALIGEVTEEHPGMVALRTSVGGRRVVPMPAGDPIPRIC
ncbi:MAG: hydrogenase expression/formation protein HypE [Candidatus Hadarchaeales archaeon]